MLAVKLSKAHGVKPSDDNGLADPYVRFVHGGKKFVSEVCRRTIHPVWEGKKRRAGRRFCDWNEPKMLAAGEEDVVFGLGVDDVTSGLPTHDQRRRILATDS